MDKTGDIGKEKVRVVTDLKGGNAEILKMLAGLVEEVQDLRDEMRRDNSRMQQELKDMKMMMREKEMQWEKEKKEIVGRLNQVEDKIKLIGEKEDCNNNSTFEKKLIELEEKVQAEARRRSEEEKSEEVEAMRRLIEKQERRDRKNNVVVRGLRVNKEGTKEQIERFFREEMDAKSEVVWAKEVGSQGKEVIIAGLRNWEEKQEVMRNKYKLRGSKVFVNHDLTRAEREIQSRILEAAREERRKGREVKVGYQKIRVDGKWIEWVERTKERSNVQRYQVFQ